MQFSKWHGLGNDYLLVERAELAVPLTPERVQKICDYHVGVGSDGIAEVVSTSGDSAEVVIWNPDGSTAELSGNGTRIVARGKRYAAYQRKWMRRIPGLVSLPADRPPGDIADAILEVARARQRLPAGRAG